MNKNIEIVFTSEFCSTTKFTFAQIHWISYMEMVFFRFHELVTSIKIIWKFTINWILVCFLFLFIWLKTFSLVDAETVKVRAQQINGMFQNKSCHCEWTCTRRAHRSFEVKKNYLRACQHVIKDIFVYYKFFLFFGFLFSNHNFSQSLVLVWCEFRFLRWGENNKCWKV